MLTVKNLEVCYGAISALRDVSFHIEAGRIVTLIGGNGAGKTTTLRTISGLLRAKKGGITFKGEDITKLPPHQIVARGLCHVPEGRMVFSNLTVDENLAMGAYLKTDKVKIAANRDYVFSVFPRLKERLTQAAGTLSGGEQQMLAIGRALMSEPKLLMLDEPSLGLSPLLSKLLLKIVRQVSKQGTSVLLVEQNARQALAISDRAYVIETGSIVLSGPAPQLAADERVQKAYLGGYEAVG
jgi:branched-chain amino acid transport system ATP-binding protein